MTPKCKATPIKTGRGMTMTRMKSFALSFVPMPNIITWTSGTISNLKSLLKTTITYWRYPED